MSARSTVRCLVYSFVLCASAAGGAAKVFEQEELGALARSPIGAFCGVVLALITWRVGTEFNERRTRVPQESPSDSGPASPKPIRPPQPAPALIRPPHPAT